jgi:hypothetical protein
LKKLVVGDFPELRSKSAAVAVVTVVFARVLGVLVVAAAPPLATPRAAISFVALERSAGARGALRHWPHFHVRRKLETNGGWVERRSRGGSRSVAIIAIIVTIVARRSRSVAIIVTIVVVVAVVARRSVTIIVTIVGAAAWSSSGCAHHARWFGEIVAEALPNAVRARLVSRLAQV